MIAPESADLLIMLGYVLLGRLVVKGMFGWPRSVAFALLNLSVFYWIFYSGADSRNLPTFLAYLALVLVQFAMLRFLASKGGWKTWLSFFTPILALVMVRYVHPGIYSSPHAPYGPLVLGISYFAFRCSQLVLDVRNEVIEVPTVFDYIGYAFFVPIMSLGPINPYTNHRRGFEVDPPAIPILRAALRVLVGLVKYKVFGSLLFQLTYQQFILDGQTHPWIDLPIAIISYYLFLYCNFSGFCDMAIGSAGIIGIPVAENFDSPFVSRNFKEFWNRWHITLSAWMRDICFSPLSKFLARVMGPANINHAIALTIMIVFLLIGIWHGVGGHFALFGLLQGLGVATVHYYTLFLKKRLGRDGFKAYNANRSIRGIAITITFCYAATSLFFFANNFSDMKAIFAALSASSHVFVPHK